MPRARKRFGQHFLHDPAVLEHIVEAISPSDRDRLVEIGPGRGALTRQLIAAPHASSMQSRSIAIWRRACATASPAQPQFTVHEPDALEFDFATLAARARRQAAHGRQPSLQRVDAVAVSPPGRGAAHIEDMYFMLQREVVQRIVAAPGDDAYGRLTVMLAPWVDAELLLKSAPARFSRPESMVGRRAAHRAQRGRVSSQRTLRRSGVRGVLAPAQDVT